MGLFDKVTARACPPARTRAADLGILGLRLTAGGLLAGHGAQKLFGAFGGNGLEGTAGWLESIGMRPGKPWAALAGLSELGGGALTALGLCNPLGPIALQGSMATAIRKVHWNKPIWNTEGGAELPVVYSTIGLALAIAGPGRYSADRAFGVRVPATVAALAAGGMAAGIIWADRQPLPAQSEEPASEEAALEAQEGGEDWVIDTQPTAPTLDADEAAWTDETPPVSTDIQRGIDDA